MKRVHFYITEEQIEQLKILNKTEGNPMSVIVRRALDNEFRRIKKREVK